MSAAAELAKRRFEELVSFFGVNAEVTVLDSPEAIEVELAVDPSGKLIGYRGETLRSLQYLINLMVQETGERRRVYVDIAGYKKARDYRLTEQARQAADRVAASGEPVELAPMTAAERRVVHLALRDDERIVTDSLGEEPKRYIVIKPR